MTLRARLTLWSIIVMALIVGFVSALDLKDEIERQFEASRQRSALILQASSILVSRTVERDPKAEVKDAVRNDTELNRLLLDLLIQAHTLAEIAVCDPNGKVLADTDPQRIDSDFANVGDFAVEIARTSWWDKTQLLWSHQSFELSQPLGAERNQPLLIVHAVIYAPLIRYDIMPAINSHGVIAMASILGAMLAALLFSAVAFRPLGKIGQMLDEMAKGDYQQDGAPGLLNAATTHDAFGEVTSKVSMLGQQLKGAHMEFSDLKGNVERLLDQLEDAVLIFGRERRLIAVAGTVERFINKPRSELTGRSLSEIFPPDTSIGLLIEQAIQTGRPVRNRRVLLGTANGSGTQIPVALMTMETMEDSSAAPGAAMLIRLRDPEATRQIGRQLQTADRLSAISRLTGGVAHEVKNPLNAILMHVELARMKLAHEDYDLEPQMEVIANEILRLDRVVKTFLDFTRPVQLNLTEVPLDTFVNELIELAGPQAVAAGINIVVQKDPEPVSITVDTDLLKQAALNIIVNAIEAMPQGGEMRIESSVRGDNAEIRISDTGPGIPPEVKEKIYDLYFTTKQQGSGIGLAMTFRIVQLHDGTIDFASEPGKGTSFSMRFPVAVATA